MCKISGLMFGVLNDLKCEGFDYNLVRTLVRTVSLGCRSTYINLQTLINASAVF